MEQIEIISKKDGKKYSVRSNRDRFFFPEEWAEFYDKLKEQQKITFSTLINTGARINEARNILPTDIDFERKRVVLRVTKVKAKKKEKNPRPRIIPISTQYSRQIKRHITETGELKILSTPAANIAMKKALQKAGIKDWYMFSIHNIRKTLEVWLMALNIDGLTITAHIGHSMKTASEHYISPDIFSWKERKMIREIIGDLYQR